MPSLSLNAVPRLSRGERQAWQCPSMPSLSLNAVPRPSREERYGSAPSCPLSLNAVPRPSREERQVWQCLFMPSLSQRRAPALPWVKAGLAVPLHALSLSTPCPGPPVGNGRLGSAPSCPLSLNAVTRPSREERQAWQCPFMPSLSQRRAPALPWGKAGLAVPLHALSLSTPCPDPLV
jgi:hypothetical protein